MSAMSQRDTAVGVTGRKRPFHRRHGRKRNHIEEKGGLRWVWTKDWQRQPNEWPELFSTFHPSITSLLQRETLTPSVLLFLRPINNLICCHMIMLRPGVQLPNQLNKYFFCLEWIRFTKPNYPQEPRQLTSHKKATVARSTYCTGLKKDEQKNGWACWEIYILKLIHWHNNAKGQLLFCSVWFYSRACR